MRWTPSTCNCAFDVQSWESAAAGLKFTILQTCAFHQGAVSDLDHWTVVRTENALVSHASVALLALHPLPKVGVPPEVLDDPEVKGLLEKSPALRQVILGNYPDDQGAMAVGYDAQRQLCIYRADLDAPTVAAAQATVLASLATLDMEEAIGAKGLALPVKALPTLTVHHKDETLDSLGIIETATIPVLEKVDAEPVIVTRETIEIVAEVLPQ